MLATQDWQLDPIPLAYAPCSSKAWSAHCGTTCKLDLVFEFSLRWCLQRRVENCISRTSQQSPQAPKIQPAWVSCCGVSAAMRWARFSKGKFRPQLRTTAQEFKQVSQVFKQVSQEVVSFSIFFAKARGTRNSKRNETAITPTVLENFMRYQEIPRDTRRYQEIPRDTKRYQEIPRDTRRYQEIPRDTRIYQDIPFWVWYNFGISWYILMFFDNGFQEIPRYTTIYQSYTNITLVYLGISRYILI